MASLTGKIALVTGGTGGIGTAICRELANKGCLVVANYLDGVDDGIAWQAAQKADDYDFKVAAGNVADFESADAMVKQVETDIGAIDILINCAGITRDSTLKRMKAAQWMDVINVNLNSVFNVTKPVANGMSRRGWGRIINISSVNGQKGQMGQANYAAAKAGMHGFTMSLAQELATRGVTVNTVSPGYIATSMVLDMPEKVRNQIVDQVPMKRLAEPDEIAWTVGFLADTRSAFITGSNLAVNGGLHMG